MFKCSFFLSFQQRILFNKELYQSDIKDNNIVVQDEKTSLNMKFKNLLHSNLQ